VWPNIITQFSEEASKRCSSRAAEQLPENDVINTICLVLPVCLYSANHNDWSRWFAISSPPYLSASHTHKCFSVLWVGFAEK
jgi:hypothetical protein